MLKFKKNILLVFFVMVLYVLGCVQKKKASEAEQEEEMGTVVSGGILTNSGVSNRGMINQMDSVDEGPLNFANSYFLTTQEAIHKLSLKLTGRPSVQSLKAHPEILNGNTDEFLSKAFDELTAANGENSEQFTEWVLTILRDQWRIQVIRNDGINEWDTWRMKDTTPEILLFNKKYLTKHPDRVFFDPENPGTFGGDGFDLPPSTFDVPGDAGYALYELEPLLFGAYLVLENQPFGKIVDSSETVRSQALQDFASGFPAENPQWNPSGSSLRHWSGEWKHGERRRPDGSSWGGGVLTTVGFLKTYFRERSWAANGIYRGMLCQNISEAAVPPQSIKLEKQGDPNPLLNGGSCRGCHNMLDGLANLRMEYGIHAVPNWIGWASAYYPAHYSRLINLDSSGMVSIQSMNDHHKGTLTRWPMTHYLLKEDGTYAGVESMAQLGARLATMPRFHRCQVGAFVDALVQTSSLQDKEKLYRLALEAYYREKQSIKAALKAVVLSEVFNGRPR